MVEFKVPGVKALDRRLLSLVWFWAKISKFQNNWYVKSITSISSAKIVGIQCELIVGRTPIVFKVSHPRRWMGHMFEPWKAKATQKLRKWFKRLALVEDYQVKKQLWNVVPQRKTPACKQRVYTDPGWIYPKWKCRPQTANNDAGNTNPKNNIPEKTSHRTSWDKWTEFEGL